MSRPAIGPAKDASGNTQAPTSRHGDLITGYGTTIQRFKPIQGKDNLDPTIFEEEETKIGDEDDDQAPQEEEEEMIHQEMGKLIESEGEIIDLIKGNAFLRLFNA